MPIDKIQGNISSSNYLSFDGTNENLTLLSASANIGKNASLTVGAGNYWTLKDGKNKNEPTIEVKGKYNIGKNLNTQFRFREIGGVEQYRITFGGNYSFNKNNSIYASVHATSKKSNEWKHNTGGWIGYTHKFKKGISISGEFQQNIPLNKNSKNFEKTINCFDDSNKMFNVIVSVPFK